VLGWDASATFTSGGVYPLRPGDIFLLVTDGYAETSAPSCELFGRERITWLLRQYQSYSAAEILGLLQSETEKFRGGVSARDDLTAVVMKVL
jgi:serine phosphatase RsbU (regulator of sigma subunit)